ncbi:MAG: four helix bundle protein [Adhaeribacter sp.]|nr:four helix bundle protein [Adhaeribacter sp.]
MAYKESLEAKYSLSLLKGAGYLDDTATQSVIKEADELRKILFSVLKTTRINIKN